MPPTGLNLTERLPFEKWVAIGQLLATSQSSMAWCLGDWLIHGESAFTGRYREVIELYSFNYQTLRNYAWVARRFPLSRRRDKLSFGHHAEVASCPEAEQDYWLRRAEEHGWSRNRLRCEVRASARLRSAAESDGSGDDALKEAAIRLSPTAGQLEIWERAASNAGVELSVWAVQVLNASAGARGAAGALVVDDPDRTR
ncbi:LmbU family transcriptional regulator [Kitasatospora sp. NPDC058048]|uniref:LmbU family transcriptional regulator n=1 Tax=Kitasatospora sp. NPDC058048 TaxID=3346313 RepID=UPI0036DDF46D